MYNKPHLSFREQIDLLEKRGLIIQDRNECIYMLSKIGYYRLSAYWYPFRKIKPNKSQSTKYNYRYDCFAPGYNFNNAVSLYKFDSRLRLLIIEALEIIEVQLRTKVAHEAGKRDKFIHLDRSKLDKKNVIKKPKYSARDSYTIWLDKHKQQINRAKNEDFIGHCLAQYGKNLPIWMATEIMDFGSISKLFDFLPKEIKNQISPSFGVTQGSVLSSWMRNLNEIRNISAHHSRLWNRSLSNKISRPNPSIVKDSIVHLGDISINNRPKVYSSLVLITYILSFLESEGDWRNRLISLIEDFPTIKGIDVGTMGFPKKWRKLDVWRADLNFLDGTTSSQ